MDECEGSGADGVKVGRDVAEDLDESANDAGGTQVDRNGPGIKSIARGQSEIGPEDGLTKTSEFWTEKLGWMRTYMFAAMVVAMTKRPTRIWTVKVGRMIHLGHLASKLMIAIEDPSVNGRFRGRLAVGFED